MVVFYNPHVDDFLAEPVHFRLLRRRALKKYGFVFEQMAQSEEPIRVLVDASASGIIPAPLFGRLPYFLRKAFAEIEYSVWKRINKFTGELQRVKPATEPSADLLFAFSYKAATGKFELRRKMLSNYKSVIFHLSHYFVDTSEKAENIRSLPNAVLAGDSDIRNIEYFQRWYAWYDKPFLVLPFAVQARFQNIKLWGERENKAVATGSFHDLLREEPASRYADYIDTSGETTYHPIRKAIYEARDRNEQWVRCNVSPYRDYQSKGINSLMRHFQVSQKGYFAINIVDLYNSCRFAVVGEEFSGFPALGAIEAMACGCVLVAQGQYYEGLGLSPGEHYIEYAGQLPELVEKIATLQQQQLSELSAHAAAFVQHEFSPSTSWKKWMKQWSAI